MGETFHDRRVRTYREALESHNVDWAEYCALQVLWEDGPATAPEAYWRIDPRYSDRDTCQHLAPHVIEQSLERSLRLGRLIKEERGLDRFEVTQAGCALYEAITTQALGPGAWITCSLVEQVSPNVLMITAVNTAGLWWRIGALTHTHSLANVGDEMPIGQWMYNRHKTFNTGIQCHVTYSKGRPNEAFHFDVISRMHQVLDSIPPFSWATE